MPWVRPKDAAFPSVWHRFEGRIPLSDGTVPKFRVQDLTEDLHDEALDLMCNIFLRDEPICKFSGYTSCSKSVELLRESWQHILSQKVALVCVLDEIVEPNEKPTIVGVNMTGVCQEEDINKFSLHADAEKWNMNITTLGRCEETCDVFKKFCVTAYMTALGLVIKPQFRGQGIGLEILKARVPICKAVGLKLTATVFTAIPSQILAKKCGFELLGEIVYEDLEELGIAYPGITTPSAKWMAMKIN